MQHRATLSTVSFDSYTQLHDSPEQEDSSYHCCPALSASLYLLLQDFNLNIFKFSIPCSAAVCQSITASATLILERNEYDRRSFTLYLKVPESLNSYPVRGSEVALGTASSR